LGDTCVVTVAKSIAKRDEFLSDIRLHLDQAQAIYKHYYDKHHRELPFVVGDCVWLRLRHPAPASLQVASSGKLRPCYYRAYRISAIINDVTCHLELPPCARLHDIFHVGLLKKFVGEPPSVPLKLPPMHHGAVVPGPEHAVCARLARGVRLILIRWKGEPTSSATWEDVNTFMERYPAFQLEDELLLEGRGGGEMSCGAANTSDVAGPAPTANPAMARIWIGLLVFFLFISRNWLRLDLVCCLVCRLKGLYKLVCNQGLRLRKI
jgi:hypothetical protein